MRIYFLCVISVVFMALFICGCGSIPIKNGELEMGEHTSATLDDIGVARINNRF